jgi:carbonic anhydrase
MSPALPPRTLADTPDAALQLLIDGNARYVRGTPRERDFSAGRASRAVGQAPFAAILGCADSRVTPELAFDQGPGDLFVVRIAGNFVTDEGLASLEFGVTVLRITLILVLGHTGCGAVDATLAAIERGSTFPGHIADLVTAMRPGIEPALDLSGDRDSNAVLANVRHNVDLLRRAQPILADPVARDAVRVVGGVYDLATGRVRLLEPLSEPGDPSRA